MKILYKIVGAVLALAIIPIAIFAPLVKLVVSSSVLSIFSSSESSVVINDSYSIRELYTLFESLGGKNENVDIMAMLKALPENVTDKLAAPFIAFLVLFALVILCSLALILVFLISKKKKAVIVTGIIGILLTLGMNFAFGRFAAPLVSGTVSIMDILNNSGLLSQFLGGGLSSISSIFSSLLGGDNSSLIDIRLFDMGTAYVFMLMSYGAATLWAGAHALIDWE